MKKIILFVILLTVGISLNAQDSYNYYKMRELYDQKWGGFGEWLANSKKWLNFWGIQFAAGNKVRATLSNNGSWYFAAPSSEYDANKFNTINSRLELWKDVAIGTDKSITAKSYFLSDISNNNTIYGVLGLGRNLDPTLRTLSGAWLRLGSKTGIAMWANDNAASDDSPHVLLENDGTFNVRYNIRALVGTGDLYLKGGRNGDPTIRTSQDKWLRIGSKVGVAMWANDNVESDESPHVLLENNGTFNVRYNIRALVGTGDLYLKGGKNGDPTIRTSQNKWLRIGGKVGIFLWGNDNVEANDNPTLSIVGDNVGIGTGINSPEDKLDIRNGGIRVSNNNIKVLVGTNAATTAGWMGTMSNHALCLGANNGQAIFIDASQRVYVGLDGSTIDKIKADLKNKYDLFVDKGVLAEDYAIAPKSTWSDFVFSKEYILPSLLDVENFIIENKHLPDVPSATQVAEEGYSQHEMNKTLLEKIEQLTLYIIEQQKQINELKLQQSQFK